MQNVLSNLLATGADSFKRMLGISAAAPATAVDLAVRE
jgi:hypothetical protein